eukprot:scaffold585_cov97-Cylindrotheca_fusiformis.AAC.4
MSFFEEWNRNTAHCLLSSSSTIRFPLFDLRFLFCFLLLLLLCHSSSALHSHNLGPYHDDNKATFSKSQACSYWWLYCCRQSNNNNNNYVLPLQARRRHHHHHHENDGYDDDNGDGKQQHGENVSVSVGNKEKKKKKKKKSLMLPPPCQELASILKEVKLPLEPISDLGYYGWKPELRIQQQQQQQTAMEEEQQQQMKKRSNGSPRMRIVVASTIPLPHVTANDIRRNVHLNETPRIPCDLKAFRDSLPRNVTMAYPNDDDDDDDDTIASPAAAAATTTLILPNKYPYGQTSIASLYAAKQKGVPLEEVNFLFGSYTLYHLAFGHLEEGEKSIAARVPGTNIVLVTRYKEYMQNTATKGHAFEDMILKDKEGGKGDGDTSSLNSAVHLQLMQIGKSKVLFAGETDAMDPLTGHPIEIKFGIPAKRKIRILFQMISSGSLSVIVGNPYLWWNNNNNKKKKPPVASVSSVEVISLRQYANEKPRTRLGRAIKRRMRSLRHLANNNKIPDDAQIQNGVDGRPISKAKSSEESPLLFRRRIMSSYSFSEEQGGLDRDFFETGQLRWSFPKISSDDESTIRAKRP